jgi:predicted alpha/beta-fold hydrolase
MRDEAGVGGELDGDTAFRSPRWAARGHAQTIYPYFLPRPDVVLHRERVETPDGTSGISTGSRACRQRRTARGAVHGLEGGARSHYARNLMFHLASRKWRGVIPHFRGCGGEPNRLPRAYHSGDYEEVGSMLAHIRSRFTARCSRSAYRSGEAPC